MTITVEISVSENISAGLNTDMSAADDIDVSQKGCQQVPAGTLLQSWASAAYLDSIPAVASMLITTSDEMQQLNKQYRDKNKPTNVLSFPMQLPEDIDMHLLGDIALCASIINHEASQQFKKQNAHWAHMVVHGMLHLQGFDHLNDSEAEEMEQLEIKILDRLGVANPYQQINPQNI